MKLETLYQANELAKLIRISKEDLQAVKAIIESKKTFQILHPTSNGGILNISSKYSEAIATPLYDILTKELQELQAEFDAL